MFPKSYLFLILALALSRAESASILERSYEYVKSLGLTLAPDLVAMARCLSAEEAWACAHEKAGKLLDGWDAELEQQRRSWGAAADREVAREGRGRGAPEEPPSALAEEVEGALHSLTDLLQNSLAKAAGRKKGGGGIDSITLSTTSEKKKKMKKKKQKPQKIQIIQARPHHMAMMEQMMKKQGRTLQDNTRTIPVQAWVIGYPEQQKHEITENQQIKSAQNHARYARNVDEAWAPVVGYDVAKTVASARKNYESKDMNRAESVKINSLFVKPASGNNDESSKTIVKSKGRSVMQGAWNAGEQATAMLSEALNLDEEKLLREHYENRDVGEQRGKKKKKKKAILKLLLLGAVAKAKIGLLLQILSAHLQVKFFLIALAGLAINIARFWLDLKKGGQPQKVIYYEHAQHQHHYEHEDEGWGGSPWSRSLDLPKEQENIYPALETEREEAPEHTAPTGPYRPLPASTGPYRAYGGGGISHS